MSNEIEEESSFNAGWSQAFDIQSVQDTWSASVASVALEIAEFDPRVPVPGARVSERKKVFCSKTKNWVEIIDPFNDEFLTSSVIAPEEISAFESLSWKAGAQGVDMLPHLFDSNSQDFLLVDSGSQICTFPPDPGDVPDPHMFLRAVNGTRIQCYGTKEVVIKINIHCNHYQIA